jgi:hypothetical protein
MNKELGNILAKHAKLLLVFLSILLVFLNLTIVTGETPQPIYKVGDYFVYKVTFSDSAGVCSGEATIRLQITNIKYPYVYARQKISDVKISGSLCSGLSSFLPPPSEEDVSFRIDEKPSTQQPFFEPFVDPSYSGTYQISSPYGTGELSSKYYNGVLISAEIKTNFAGINLSSNINLVDTSVPGLISGNINIMLIIIVIIISVVVAVIAVTLFIIMRRRKTLVQSAPSSITPLAPNYCPRCGSPIAPEDVYCGNCGYKLRGESNE